MFKYFDDNYTIHQFEYFSPSHTIALLLILLLCILLFIFRQHIKSSLNERFYRYFMVFFLITPLILFNVFHIYHNTWDIGSTLPLEFCRMSAILSAIMLINKNYTLYEINYFWGLCGTTQALITPNIGNYDLPHFLYFQFFSYHGFVIIAVFYMTFVHKFRPAHKSIWKVAVISGIYTILIGFIDILTNGNYLYLRYKPTTETLIDYLGPWPWYIVSIGIVGLLSGYICYLPIAKKNRQKNLNNR